jgi:hypothetical protein
MFVDGPRWRFGLEEGLGALAASGEFWGANLWVAIYGRWPGFPRNLPERPGGQTAERGAVGGAG